MRGYWWLRQYQAGCVAQHGSSGKATKLCFLAMEAWPGEGKHHDWQAGAEGERDCERRPDCAKLSIFLCKPNF